MKNELTKGLRIYEELAQKTTKSTKWLIDISDAISCSSVVEQLSVPMSFGERYPGLLQLGLAQTALNNGVFQRQMELAREIEALCEPYRNAQEYIVKYEKSLSELARTGFSSLVQTDKYVITNNLAVAMKNALLPALEAVKVDTDGMAKALLAIGSAIDTSWIQTDTAWAVKASELFKIDTSSIAHAGLTALLTMEQQTSRILAENGITQITSVAAQIASITCAYADFDKRWKEIVVPFSLLGDLEDIAFRQHEEIQKNADTSKWRLGLLNSTSRFVDRQVKWSNELLSGLHDQIVDDDEEVIESDDVSAVSLIPQYLGYTRRKNVNTTPEKGLEKSTIVEVTEKGKQIVENVVRINELCAATGKKQMFKYTGKLVITSTRIGSLVCSSADHFGTMIDGFYMMFYGNLEHIKSAVTDVAVRNEEVYKCIFRIKDMRTDLRHDYEHGNESSISKKRTDIMECYRHYANKPALVCQRDYVTLQRRMYDEFLLLEKHLISMLCENSVMH